MNLMAILSFLEGAVSSVPEAIALFNKIKPYLGLKEELPDHVVSELSALAPAAMDAVNVAHNAIATLIAVHKPPAAE